VCGNARQGLWPFLFRKEHCGLGSIPVGTARSATNSGCRFVLCSFLTRLIPSSLGPSSNATSGENRCGREGLTLPPRAPITALLLQMASSSAATLLKTITDKSLRLYLPVSPDMFQEQRAGACSQLRSLPS
jgi:hypothetical protein